MKKLSFLFILSILFTSVSLTAQYGYDDDFYDDDFYPGYLGDNFSLEGALETFKDSRSIDEFEHRINNRDNYVNNLDLNNDGRTDFIRVSDVSDDRNNRLLVMQAVLGRKDVQDVAVIAIEKTGRRRANLQIIGDEYLFGPDMVLEPNDIAYNQNRRGYGPAGDVVITRGFVNVFYWPIVRNIFAPRYSFYRSPYYWGYYPRVWNPWRPFYYNTYYDRCSRFRRGFFRPAPAISIVYVNNFYRPRRRAFSPWIRDRYNRCAVVYNRDRTRRGVNRRTISQTPPDRRRDFDRRRGIRDDRRFERGVAGTNNGRNSNRGDRGRDNVSTRIERGGYIGRKGETSKPTNRQATRAGRSAESVDRRSSSTRADVGAYSGNDRKTSSTRSERGSTAYNSNRNSSTKSNRGSSSYKSDRKSSTVNPNRSSSSKSNSSYKSNRSSSTKPSRSSSSYKSDRRSSTVKSNRGTSTKSASSRSSSKVNSSSRKSSSAYKSSRGSSAKSSKSAKSSRSSKKGF